VTSRDGPTLNDALASTAKLMLSTSLLLAAGFVVGAARP
jgi:hypothetical protein